MLMVVFGAGASYDSFPAVRPPQYENSYRPPLADQLFALRFGDDYNLFPQCHAVISLLQLPGVNVEAVLEELQQQAGHYPLGLTQLAAIRYYLQRMLWRCQDLWTRQVTKGPTNYKTLLDQIARRPVGKDHVCLVTFNYDTLLDEALTSRGNELGSISDYVGSDFKLIKLHGSINWAHDVRNFPVSNGNPSALVHEIINRAPTLDVNGESFEIVHGDPFNRQFGRPLFPALAIPVENKPGYECPENHQKVLLDSLPQVTKVLMVGWRAGENRFLKTLAEGITKRASIMVVSSNEASSSKIVERIIPIMRDAKVMGDFFAAKTNFSDLIFSSELNDFLR